jgi:hypothetical protein
MWRLSMAMPGEAWATIDNFDSVTAAAEKIRALESYPVSGIFLEVLIETAHGDEGEAFGHLEHTGRTTALTSSNVLRISGAGIIPALPTGFTIDNVLYQ